MNVQINRRFLNASSLLISCLAMLFLAAACATSGKQAIAPASASSKPTEEKKPDAAPAAEPAPDQKTLAAIEDFLSRTQQYRQAPDPLVLGNPPAPATAPPTTPGRSVAASAGASENRPETRPSELPRKQTSTNAELTAEPQQAAPILPVPAVERVTIQWNDTAAPEEPQPHINAANTPMTAAAAGREPAAGRMLDELEADVAARKDFESAWRLKLAQLAAGHDEEAAEAASQLSEESASLLSALVRTAVAVRSAAGDPLDDGKLSLERVDSLRQLLAAHADPIVSGVALCRKVVTFGMYEELPPDEFVSGRTIQLIVYSEVANFRSRKTDEGAYETALATRLEVFTKKGESVWEREEPEVLDTCRNLRRDFFIAQRVTLPPTLPAGDYVLKVRVEDKLASKAGEAVKPFTIHSPISVAKKP